MESIDKDFGVSSTKLNDIIKRAEEINARIPFHRHLGFTVGLPSTIILFLIAAVTTFAYNKFKKIKTKNRELIINFQRNEYLQT